MGSDSVVGTLIAADQGYTLRQIADAIMANRLNVYGEISDGYGGVSTPSGTPQNVLRNYFDWFLSARRLFKAGPSGHSALQGERFTKGEVDLISSAIDLWVTSEQQSVPDILDPALLSIAKGYMVDKVMDAILNFNMDSVGDILGVSPTWQKQLDVFIETITNAAGGNSSGGTDSGTSTSGGTSGGSSAPVTFPITYKGWASYTITSSADWGSKGSAKCQGFEEITIRLAADGTVTSGGFPQASDIGFVYIDPSGSASCSYEDNHSYIEYVSGHGTHSNGQFTYTLEGFGASSSNTTLTGTYNAYGIQGSGSSDPVYYSSYPVGLGAETTTYAIDFNIVTAQ